MQRYGWKGNSDGPSASLGGPNGPGSGSDLIPDSPIKQVVGPVQWDKSQGPRYKPLGSWMI